ncbi:MAG: hypothetical protein IT168_09765 [Bryobacterales bacterium]|nr:hypothetical protein [Bryobacterales bacterium]
MRSAVEIWNRKGHYYLGLYFLFFLWLFAFTGLLLNHGWQFAEFWPNRTVTRFEREIQVPPTGADLNRARRAMSQLGITGEIEWTGESKDPALFQFRAVRPGKISTVAIDIARGNATVEQIAFNGWGTMRVLHTFTGVRRGDARNGRDWALTTVWVLAMDAVSAGLILMVLSGIYMWWRVPGKRRAGLAALMLGITLCGGFVFGLRAVL